MSTRALTELYERYLPQVTELSVQHGLWPAALFTGVLGFVIVCRFGGSGLLLVLLVALVMGIYTSPVFSAVVGVLFYILLFYRERWYGHWYDRFLK